MIFSYSLPTVHPARTNTPDTSLQLSFRLVNIRRKSLRRNSPNAFSDLCTSWGAKFCVSKISPQYVGTNSPVVPGGIYNTTNSFGVSSPRSRWGYPASRGKAHFALQRVTPPVCRRRLCQIAGRSGFGLVAWSNRLTTTTIVSKAESRSKAQTVKPEELRRAPVPPLWKSSFPLRARAKIGCNAGGFGTNHP